MSAEEPRGIKNVTPPDVAAELEASRSSPGSPEGGPVDDGTGWRRTTWRSGTWQGTYWEGNWSSATPRRTFPWFGLFVILVGVALLLQALEPRLDGAGLFAIAAGIPFFLAWSTRQSRFALWPAVIFLGYGVARLAVGLELVVGGGWTTLGIGAGLLVGWLLSTARGGGSRWTLLFAGLFLLFGLVQVSAQFAGLNWFGDAFWAVAIIALGVFLLGSGLRRRA